MSKDLLKKKVFGVIVTTGESLSIPNLIHYTQESEEDVREVVDELVEENKLEWNEPDSEESNT